LWKTHPFVGVFRKNLIVLAFRLLFMPPLFPVDIRGAARPGQNSLPVAFENSICLQNQQDTIRLCHIYNILNIVVLYSEITLFADARVVRAVIQLGSETKLQVDVVGLDLTALIDTRQVVE
jgi:hypothetical protein